MQFGLIGAGVGAIGATEGGGSLGTRAPSAFHILAKNMPLIDAPHILQSG